MATHSSVPAWRIPGMGEPGGLPSMGSHRVGHDWGDAAAAAAAVVLFYWCNWEPLTMKQPLSIRNKQPKYCIHEQERVICTSFRFRKCYDLSVCIPYKFICQNAVEQRWRLREQTCGHRCGRGGRINREIKIDISTLLCVKWLASGKLLYCAGSWAQGSVMT